MKILGQLVFNPLMFQNPKFEAFGTRIRHYFGVNSEPVSSAWLNAFFLYDREKRKQNLLFFSCICVNKIYILGATHNL